MKAYKLVATGINAGSYDLIDRASGQRLGEVIKHVQHYNIAPRGCTVTYWTASFVTPTSNREMIRHTTLAGREETTHFGTRAEALAAIEVAMAAPATMDKGLTALEQSILWLAHDEEAVSRVPRGFALSSLPLTSMDALRSLEDQRLVKIVALEVPHKGNQQGTFTVRYVVPINDDPR